MNDNDFDVVAFLVGNVVLAVLLWMVFFGFFAAIAALVAPPGRRVVFFVLTFFFFGPLGIALAVIANPRDPKPPAGFYARFCHRCAARNVVGDDADRFVCWRCKRDHGVLPKQGVRGALGLLHE